MSQTLTDSEVFQVTKFLYKKMEKYEKINSLHPEEIEDLQHNQIRPLHPHKRVKASDGSVKSQKYTCWEIFCQLSIGKYLCCDNHPSDDPHKDLGLAMCLYFKSLKHLFCVFFFIALLSAISVLLCYLVAVRNDVHVTKSYKQFLFSSSIGVLFLEEIQCNYFLSGTTPVVTANFQLTCAVGYVSKIGPVYTTNTYQSITNCNKQLIKIQDESSEVLSNLSYSQITDCSSKSVSCTSNLTITSPNTKYQYLSYVYQCTDAVYSIGSLKLTKKIIIYIIIAIDLVSVLLLMIFIWSQSRAEDQQVDYFKNYQFTLSDYSVQVKHMKTDSSHIQTKNLFQSLKELDPQQQLRNGLVQIKFPDSHHYRQIQKVKLKYSKKVYDIIKEAFFYKHCTPYSHLNSQQFVKNQFKNQMKYQQYKYKLIKALQDYVDYTQEFKNKEETTHKSPIVLTFQRMDLIQKMKSFRKKKCFKKYLQVNRNQRITDYRLREAPKPDLILFQNRYKNKHLRRFLSWVITILIIFGSLLLIGYVISRQNTLLKKYNFNVDCLSAFPEEPFNDFNNTLLYTNPFYQQCFCSSHAVLSKIVDSQFSEECSDWSNQYAWYLAIPVLFSFCIVVYNVIISYFFFWLSIFEAHSLLNTQMTSYIIKRSIVLILNMGVILTFLNFDYGFTDGFLSNYQGSFKDFAGDWYLQIGIIIILTIIFNIGFPIIQLILYSVFYCLQTIWDTRCFCRKTSFKYKYQYIQMYGGFTYPIQERYATILAVFFITIGLNAVLPLINIIVWLFLAFLILTDRCLVFKLFRKLPNYQDTLHRNMMKVFFVFLMIHLIITAFLFTEPLLIVGNQTSLLNISNKRISAIFNTNYILPYPIILFLMIVFIVLKYFCNILENCCKSKSILYQDRPNLKKPFYQAINGRQMKQLLIISQYQAQKQQEEIANVNFLQINDDIPVNSLHELKQSQKAHIHLEQIQTKKINKLKQIKKPIYYMAAPPRLYGPASYEKQFNQRVVQEEIQMIALDKICKKVSKRIKGQFGREPDAAYERSSLVFTQGSQIQKLNNILDVIQQNRLADINIEQPYFNNQSANMLREEQNVQNTGSNV